MANGASHVRMPLGQRESSGAMIERGAGPVVEIVARLALRWWKPGWVGFVRGIRGVLKVRHVTRFAGRRKPQVIADGCIFMAFLALDYSVGAEQRKSVEVLLDRLDRHLPAEYGMALGAVLAKLSAMNVGVTIGAVLANLGENRPGVATCAGYFFVHAAKRIPRRVMVEFRNGANRSPACVGVAIFARNG